MSSTSSSSSSEEDDPTDEDYKPESMNPSSETEPRKRLKPRIRSKPSSKCDRPGPIATTQRFVIRSLVDPRRSFASLKSSNSESTMVGRSSRNRSKPSPANAGTQPAPARRPVEIINCFDDDDDVIIEENGDKEGEQLVMECEEEELTPEQQRAYEMAEQSYDNANYAPQPAAQYASPSIPVASNNGSSSGARPTRSSGRSSANPSPSTSRAPPAATQRRQAPQRTPAQRTPQQLAVPTPPSGSRGTRSSSRKVEETVTLLVDAKTGGVIGSVPDSAVPTLVLPAGTALRKATKSAIPNAEPLQMTGPTRGRGGQRQIVMPTTVPARPSPAKPPPRATPPQQAAQRAGRAGPSPSSRGRAVPAPPTPPPARGRAGPSPAAPASRARVAPIQPKAQVAASRAAATVAASPPIVATTVRTVELKPSVAAGSKPARGPLAPFPTLFTFPKPYHTLQPAAIQAKRTELDAKVKGLLVYAPSKFTEWLIQAGLLRSKQNCATHKSPKGEPLPLKLAMYNDSTKFPSTGGYVWISDCCPERFVSVFRGSIFEGQNHPPVTVLKLIYHWACQTNPSNVMSWVKTEAHYINGFYRLLRSLCALAVYSEMPKFGGINKTVEVASVHLFSPSTPGRTTSVEVFCVYDRFTRLVRLQAVDRGRTSASSRYASYRQFLTSVVHPRSVVIVDPSLEVGSLAQALPSARFVADGRQTDNVVGYVTKHMPKIFANTLGSLNTAQVQPFLDELAWREKWGKCAGDAYDGMMSLLSAETKKSDDMGEALIARLSKIASAPSAKTLHQMVPAGPDENAPAPTMKRGGGQAVAGSPSVGQRQGLKRPAPAGPSSRGGTPVSTYSPADEHVSAAKRMRPPEMVKLGEYYYGQMEPNKVVQVQPPSSFKCPTCLKLFTSNVAFTRHLFMHLESARSFSIDLGDLTLCKYCFRNFGTPYAMQNHVEEVHLRKHNSLVCGICNEPFKTRMDLIGHMHVNHVQAELPYGCELCGFRSSFHRCLLDHFETAHSVSDRMLCHFCLKTYNNRSVFFQHIQKHQGKKDQPAGSKNKCRKCCLSFQKPEHLRDHLQKDHISFTGFAGYKPSPGLDEDVEEIMMPKPDEKKRRKGPPVFFPSVYPNGLLNVSLMKKPGESSMQMGKVKCLECGNAMDKGHCKTAWHCSHCRYSTFCDAMASSHVARFHGPSPSYDMSQPICLKKTMFCVCGFGSYSGNQLASHLAICGKKSAYPSRHRASLATVSAQSATFPELITLEDEDDSGGEGGGDFGGDSFDGGDFGGEDSYDDGVEGFSGGLKSDQTGRVGADGKKRRRRRHGHEDINTIWLKAIWKSQNKPFPNGDVGNPGDYEYVDEETPEVLQALGLHKHGACKKVKKVAQQEEKKEAASKAASPEPGDVLKANEEEKQPKADDAMEVEEQKDEHDKEEVKEGVEEDAKMDEEEGKDVGETQEVEEVKNLNEGQKSEEVENKLEGKAQEAENEQNEAEVNKEEEQEEKKEDKVDEAPKVEKQEGTPAETKENGHEGNEDQAMEEEENKQKPQQEEAKSKEEAVLLENNEEEAAHAVEDNGEEASDEKDKDGEAIVVEENTSKEPDLVEDKVRDEASQLLEKKEEEALGAEENEQGAPEEQEKTEVLEIVKIVAVSEALPVQEEMMEVEEATPSVIPDPVQELIHRIEAEMETSEVEPVAAGQETPVPEQQGMSDVAEELIKSLIPDPYSQQQQQGENGDQLPDFSQMNQDSMDLDVAAGFSLDQFT